MKMLHSQYMKHIGIKRTLVKQLSGGVALSLHFIIKDKALKTPGEQQRTLEAYDVEAVFLNAKVPGCTSRF